MAHILIVEDEKSLSTAYQTILEAHGHRASIANDGEEALKAVEAEKPDLVLLDMKMPRMDGLGFLRGLEGSAPDLSIIIFSNQEDQKQIDEAFKLGAKRYLLKSWASPQDLVKVVNEALKS